MSRFNSEEEIKTVDDAIEQIADLLKYGNYLDRAAFKIIRENVTQQPHLEEAFIAGRESAYMSRPVVLIFKDWLGNFTRHLTKNK